MSLPQYTQLAPAFILLIGAGLSGFSGRFGRLAAASVALLVAILALASVAVAFFAPAPDAMLTWIPGTARTALVVTVKADALTLLLSAVSSVVCLTVLLAGIDEPPPVAVTVLRLIATSATVLGYQVGSPALTAALLLVAIGCLAVGVALSNEGDASLGLDAFSGPFFAGLAALAAGAVGLESPAGFILLLVAVLALTGQYPLSRVFGRSVDTVLGPSDTALYFGLIVAGGGYLAIRWATPIAPVWGIQAFGVAGAITTVTASVLALWQQRPTAAIAYVAAAQIGYVLLALGEGAQAAFTSGILQLTAVVPTVAGALLLANSLERGRKIRLVDGLLLGFLAAGLASLPLLHGGFIARWLLVSTALLDGRFVFAVFGVAGAGLSAAALIKIMTTLLQRTGFETTVHPVILVAGAISALPGLILGALVWTPFDPISASAIAALGQGRARPVGGDLLGEPGWTVAVAAISLVLATLIGVVVGRQRMRPRRSTAMVRKDSSADATPLVLATDPSPIGIGLWRGLRGVGWTAAAGMSALEGRYYVAAVLVFGLWLAIVMLG